MFKRRYLGIALIPLIGLLLTAPAGNARAANVSSELGSGRQLNSGDTLTSPSGLFQLAMQTDGNLVAYAPGHLGYWSTSTTGHPGSVLQMQTDGNLVVYAPGHVATWSSRTSGHTGSTLRMQNDANLVVYSTAQAATWASNTARGQQQNANLYSFWNFQGSNLGYWNVDQQMTVEQKAPATYWAADWTWTGANNGGYLGLQTDGSRLDGTTGDTAIFSLWNANAVSGPHCGPFSGEGNGYSCRLAYTITPNTYYRFRLWRLSADSGGQWWGAWIKNTATGVDTQIGSIRVAATDTLATNVTNFVEYFGTAVTCTTVPRSQAVWTQPAANTQGKGTYQYGSQYTTMSKGSCTGGSATPVNLGSTNGVRVVLGG